MEDEEEEEEKTEGKENAENILPQRIEVIENKKKKKVIEETEDSDAIFKIEGEVSVGDNKMNTFHLN